MLATLVKTLLRLLSQLSVKRKLVKLNVYSLQCFFPSLIHSQLRPAVPISVLQPHELGPEDFSALQKVLAAYRCS